MLCKMCWIHSLAPPGELWGKHAFVCHWDLQKSQWILFTSAQERNSSNTQHSRIEQYQDEFGKSGGVLSSLGDETRS